MEVAKVCDASPAQVLDAVRELVRKDMEEAKGKPVELRKAHVGAHWDKELSNRMGKAEHVKVKVEQLDEAGYRVRFSSRYGENVVSYAFEPTEAGGTQITYEEGFDGSTASSGLNHRLFAFFTQRGNRKRMQAQLDGLVRYIVNFADDRAADDRS